MIYANHETITPEQEQALVDFVEGGKGAGRDPLRVGMFTKSPRYIPLVGGRVPDATAPATSPPRSSSPTIR